MFDRYVDAFMDGHFPVQIQVKQVAEGQYEGSWTSPAGQTVTVTEASESEACRRCSDLVREGVLKREIHLGR